MEHILPFLCNKATLGWAFSCIFGDGNYIHMMDANLEALRDTMQELKYKQEELEGRVSIEEEKGLQRLSRIQGWFSRVADIESQVNALLEEAESTETGRLCLFGYCSNDCISSCEYGKKVSKKLEEVKELLSKGVFDEVADKGRVPKVKEIHIQTTVGLDYMVEKAWNILMKGEHTKTLGIYGMGGVGKTTLLAHINNKFLGKVNEFDVVIWVVVSEDLQIESIQDQILGRLCVDKGWKGETEEEKASSICNILSRKKRFVLLLDNLWSEIDLKKIGVPHPTSDNGAKIVFTTRLKEVCKDMKADDKLKVECLSPNEAWKLFQIVGEVPLKRHQDIPKLAKKIAEKCYGLPLALNVIGKAMAYKEDVHEWRHALNVLNSSSHKFPGMEKKILSILMFSYDGLKDENVKSCFLYCSLFREDYEILKERLIEYWICEGFIDGNRDEDGSNNQGHIIIGLLVRAHLLMDVVYGETTRVKMHDVLREMALWIRSNLGEGETNWVKTGAKLRSIPKDIKWEVVRRISLISNQIKEISCCPPECPNLSTLLLTDNNLESISGEFFQFMPAIVVLDLSSNKDLRELPEEISSLTSLQYLNLSGTRIRLLPMKGLRKLISLDLEGTSLKSIDGIGTSSPNLQVLKLYDSVCIDARSMEELQLLEHLKILTATIGDAMILESIQGMELLARCVQRLGIEDMSAQVVTLNTVALGGLRELVIRGSKISEIKIDWESKEKEELICLSSPCFNHLSTVHIDSLKGPKDLTWLLLVPNLRDLTVEDSSSIEEILNREKGMSISDVHPYISVPFQKLEFLCLINLPGLKRICLDPPSVPNLRDFYMEYCPKLPEAATEFITASGSEVSEGYESEIEPSPFAGALFSSASRKRSLPSEEAYVTGSQHFTCEKVY